jgi:tetratricopeptide (TPR) repeat protein
MRTGVRLGLALFFLALSSVLRADDYQDAARLFKDGKHAAAMEKVEAVLAATPKDARARFLKGLILTEQNKPQEAVKIFTSLTEDYPELPEPYNNLAVLYAAQGQYEQSRKALEMAIRTHPSYAIAHENLGDVYAKMASEAYDKALQLDRGNKTAQTKLSLIRELFSSTAPAKPPVSGTVSEPANVSATPPSTPPTAAATTAPIPGEKPAASAKAPAPDASRDVLSAVDGWAKAWSSKDVDGYLAHYSRDFATPGGESWDAWAAARRDRISKPKSIEVSIESPKVALQNNRRAVVTFKQRYRSDSLSSSGAKRLTLVKGHERWLIVQEQIDR